MNKWAPAHPPGVPPRSGSSRKLLPDTVSACSAPSGFPELPGLEPAQLSLIHRTISGTTNHRDGVERIGRPQVLSGIAEVFWDRRRQWVPLCPSLSTSIRWAEALAEYPGLPARSGKCVS